MYDSGINVFCKIIEKVLKSTKIFLILPFLHDPSTVVFSTTEAQYMVAVEVDKEIIWMKEFIRELGIRQEEFQL